LLDFLDMPRRNLAVGFEADTPIGSGLRQRQGSAAQHRPSPMIRTPRRSIMRKFHGGEIAQGT
jgi:hypothetical protein